MVQWPMKTFCSLLWLRIHWRCGPQITGANYTATEAFAFIFTFQTEHRAEKEYCYCYVIHDTARNTQSKKRQSARGGNEGVQQWSSQQVNNSHERGGDCDAVTIKKTWVTPMNTESDIRSSTQENNCCWFTIYYSAWSIHVFNEVSGTILN